MPALPFSHAWTDGDDLTDIESIAPHVTKLAELWEMLNGCDHSKFAEEQRKTLPTGPGNFVTNGAPFVYPDAGTEALADARVVGTGTNWPAIQRALISFSTQFASSADTLAQPVVRIYDNPRAPGEPDRGRIFDYVRACEDAGDITSTKPIPFHQWAGRPMRYSSARAAANHDFSDRYWAWPGPKGFERRFFRWIYKTNCPGKTGQVAIFLVRTSMISPVVWEDDDHEWLGGVIDADPLDWQSTATLTQVPARAQTPLTQRQYSGQLFRHNGTKWDLIPPEEIAQKIEAGNPIEPDVVTKYGVTQDGDIAGPWVPNQIREAMKLLRRTVVMARGAFESAGAYTYYIEGLRYDAGTMPPLAPNTYVVDLGANGLRLHWGGSRGATSYSIIRVSVNGSEIVIASNLSDANGATGYVVPKHATDSYYLIAQNAAGKSDPQTFPGTPHSSNRSAFAGIGVWWGPNGIKSDVRVTSIYQRNAGYYEPPMRTTSNGSQIGTFNYSKLRQDADYSAGHALDAFGSTGLNEDVRENTTSFGDPPGYQRFRSDSHGSTDDEIGVTDATAEILGSADEPNVTKEDNGFYPIAATTIVPYSFASRSFVPPFSATLRKHRAHPVIWHVGLPDRSKTATFYAIASKTFWPITSGTDRTAANLLGDPITASRWKAIGTASTTNGTRILGPQALGDEHGPQPYAITTAEIIKYWQGNDEIFAMQTPVSPERYAEFRAFEASLFDRSFHGWEIETSAAVIDWPPVA